MNLKKECMVVAEFTQSDVDNLKAECKLIFNSLDEAKTHLPYLLKFYEFLQSNQQREAFNI